MARKGVRKTKKRLSASRAVHIRRKENAWTIRELPGPHNGNDSIALGIALRDLLMLGGTLREIKHILQRGGIKVDGKIAKEYKTPVGLFDIITVVAENTAFRVVLDEKGRFVLAPEKPGQKEKLCRIAHKRIVKKGIVQLTTNDGRVFMEKKTELSVGDSILLGVPEQKVARSFKMEKGKTALIVSGKNVGIVAKITGITESAMNRPKLVALQAGDRSLETIASNVFIVGDEKPAIIVKSE